jgi:hypothetical protein
MGIGLKWCCERCSCSTDAGGVRGLMLSDVANEGPRRLITRSRNFQRRFSIFKGDVGAIGKSHPEI